MTHWRTEANKSKKKKHRKSGVMTKKQLKEFFGHKWGDPQNASSDVRGKGLYKVNLEIDEQQYKCTIYTDKNNGICDIEGLPYDDGDPANGIPSTYEFYMNIYRGTNINLF